MLSRKGHRVLKTCISLRTLSSRGTQVRGEKAFDSTPGADKQRDHQQEGESSTGSRPSTDYDIIINGGGVVGFSLLAALSGSPFFDNKRVLLLEQQPNRKQINRNEEKDDMNRERKLSNRTSSLTISSKQFLENLGVWPEIDSVAKKASSMHVWSHDYNKGVTFTPSFPGLFDTLCGVTANNRDNAVCYFIENHRLLNALRAKIPEDRIQFGANVTDIQSNGNQVDVVVEGQETLTTSLLIGCDGFNSLVRRKSNLKYYEQDMQQEGIVGTIEITRETENDLNDVTYQRFVPGDGSVVALLPLTPNYSSFVISTSSERAPQLMAMSDDEFVAAFNSYLFSSSASLKGSLLGQCVEGVDRVLGSVLPSSGPFSPNPPPKLSAPLVSSVVPGSRASFPLKFGTTLPYMVGSALGGQTNNVVLIGDSAHRVQPLAGQGLNLGIGDAQVLAHCLTQPLMRGERLFSPEEGGQLLDNALFEFEKQRQFKLIPMMAAIVSMQQLFAATPSNLLSAFNSLEAFKNEVVKFANSR